MTVMEQADKFFKLWLHNVYEGDVLQAQQNRLQFMSFLVQFEGAAFNTKQIKTFKTGDKSAADHTK